MKIFGIDKFCRYGIGGVSHAERLTRFGVAAVGISALNHEVADHAVKQSAVIIPFFSKFQKIGCVQRGVVIQTYGYVAQCSAHEHFGRSGLCHFVAGF